GIGMLVVVLGDGGGPSVGAQGCPHQDEGAGGDRWHGDHLAWYVHQFLGESLPVRAPIVAGAVEENVPGSPLQELVGLRGCRRFLFEVPKRLLYCSRGAGGEPEGRIEEQLGQQLVEVAEFRDCVARTRRPSELVAPAQ